ncbi:MAG TPA: magnesium transporter [Candidatus Polarisedimenticolaceae bacterium]|nr:magnesium transporter [Candidatus Polarisedimenticolaceae bacterium]
MLDETAKPRIEAALEGRDFAALRELCAGQEPADIAKLIEELEERHRAVLFRLLPRDTAGPVFEYLEPEAQQSLLRSLGQEQVATILNDMSPDDRTALLEELPASVTKHLLAQLSPPERAIAVQLLGYPEGSIGRLMTPDYVAVHPDWTMQRVFEHIRKYGSDRETLNVLYVVDDHGRLIDDLRMRQILLAPADGRITDLCDWKYIGLSAYDDQEKAIHVFQEYDRAALPVTDSNGVLLGIVTHDDVLDVAQEEATEDIHKIGAVEALEDPYMDVRFTEMVKKRARWLVILFLGEMLTATAMAFFEEEIARAVVLALFVPLIISSGGNSGSQAATLVIRAMALGEITLSSWWAVMRREIFSGLALGAILGTIGFVRITVWQQAFHMYGEHWLGLAFTVAMALMGVVLWGTLVGSMLPFLMRRLGADPAASSAPFVATLVDVTGLVIYFTVAQALLRGKLL